MNEYSYPQDMYAIKGRNGKTICFQRADGAYLYDEKDEDYLNLWNAFGSIILGFNDRDINQALKDMLRNQIISMNAPNAYLKEFRELILEDYPFMTHVGIFTSGTSAVRAAVCAAMKHRGKDIVISCGYHGWDPMWHQSTVMFETNKYMIIDCYYILEEIERIINNRGNEIAALVISPELSYFSDSYYEKIFSLCRENGVIVIVDDVKCGYRYNEGASISTEKFPADLYIVSKCIANGARISCVIGNEIIMKNIKNFCYTSYYDLYPVVSAITTLNKIKKEKVLKKIREKGDSLINGLKADISRTRLPIAITGNGSLFQFVIGSERLSQAFYRECIAQRIYLYEEDNQCPSYAFNDIVLKDALIRFRTVLDNLAEQYPDEAGKGISNERILLASYNQTHGCAESIPYNEKIEFVKSIIYGGC